MSGLSTWVGMPEIDWGHAGPFAMYRRQSMPLCECPLTAAFIKCFSFDPQLYMLDWEILWRNGQGGLLDEELENHNLSYSRHWLVQELLQHLEPWYPHICSCIVWIHIWNGRANPWILNSYILIHKYMNIYIYIYEFIWSFHILYMNSHDSWFHTWIRGYQGSRW